MGRAYKDPTADLAIGHIMKEQKRRRKLESKAKKGGAVPEGKAKTKSRPVPKNKQQ